MGSKGLGYYPDLKTETKEDKIKRKLAGKLSWLSEDPEAPTEEEEEEPKPATTALVPMPTSSAPVRTPAPAGKLSDERREKLRRQAGPFDPPLRDGKYADKVRCARAGCPRPRARSRSRAPRLTERCVPRSLVAVRRARW